MHEWQLATLVHRSGIAITTHNRLQWFIHLQAHGLKKGDEPTLLMEYGTLYLYLLASSSANLTTTKTTNPFNGPLSGTTRGGPVPEKPIWILMKHETVSGSGMS